MNKEENSAYNLFLHSGTVADYLSYVGAKQVALPPAGVPDAGGGEQHALDHRRDCAAGTRT